MKGSAKNCAKVCGQFVESAANSVLMLTFTRRARFYALNAISARQKRVLVSGIPKDEDG